ncbi:Nucleoporin nup49/NSP49 (Nuclear pore protein nup49/NSP49) [Umbelopsis sp. WA50703]
MSGRKPVFRFGAGGSAKNSKDPQVNFVFQLPGGGASTPGGFNFAPPTTPAATATPSFNFGAGASNSSAPAFGAPTPTTPTAANAPSFSFGQAAKPPPMNFGAASTNQPSAFGSSQPGAFGSQPSTPTAGFGQALPSAPSHAFNFGASTTAPPASSSAFGQNQAMSIKTQAPATSGSPFAANTSQPISAFGMSASSSMQSSPLRRAVSDVSGLNQSSQSSLLNKPGFGAGSPFGNLASNNTPAATSVVSMSASKASAPSFSFGSTTSTSAAPTSTATTAAPATGFSFGSATTPASTPKFEAPKPTGGFSFGAPSTPTASSSATSTSLFSFSKPAESEKKAVTSPFTINTSSEQSKDAPKFSFGKSEPVTSATSAASKPTTPATSTPFNFGTSKPATTPSILTSKPADGGSAAPVFSLTTSTATTTATTSATTASSVPKFSFGSTSDKKADTATTSSTAATSAPTMAPVLAAAPVPSQPSEFSFDKILEQMKVISISMPQEIQFSLANAGMPGKAMGQNALILQSTNFPIDKIEPNTRHSELPDEARNQLDELEKYMKSEMQVCGFLKKNKMVSKAEQIEKVKTDTESMIKQMEGLYSRLKGHAEIIEQLWNGVDYQHRNAVQASEIVDNYKNREHQSRWAFGYGVHNNYFALLSRNFEIRLDRYRQSIAEIEATVISMSKHKAISPKDVTDTIRMQHNSLLHATGRVVEVHEDLDSHKRRYRQYCELFYGQYTNPLPEKTDNQALDLKEHLKPLPSTS